MKIETIFKKTISKLLEESMNNRFTKDFSYSYSYERSILFLHDYRYNKIRILDINFKGEFILISYKKPVNRLIIMEKEKVLTLKSENYSKYFNSDLETFRLGLALLIKDL